MTFFSICYSIGMRRARRLAALGLTLALAAAKAEAGASFGIRDGATFAAETAAGIGSSLLLLPVMAAYSLPHYGFEEFPYNESDGYGNGARTAAFESRGSEQLT